MKLFRLTFDNDTESDSDDVVSLFFFADPGPLPSIGTYL
ncbi:hypothetical protein D3OALGA1CA_2377 [Olavius algarvensis associated proteobacterium Delta 3]|nr:hypothetical protein D3OALGA1CA_2377 [Olavius algarvensis associated proteobacterium Delta 3]